MENMVTSNKSSSSSSSLLSWKVLYLLNQGRWNPDATRCMPQTTALLQTELGKKNGRNVLLENCLFGNIFVSRIRRGTSIAPHCGPTNIRHRLHLPLVLPSSSSSSSTNTTKTKFTNCNHDKKQQQQQQQKNTRPNTMPILKVREVETTWTPKTALVFDDSLCHSVEFPAIHNDEVEDEENNNNNNNSMDPEEKEERVVLIVDLFHHDLSIRERQFLRDLYPAAT
jgi:hypothetical protein